MGKLSLSSAEPISRAKSKAAQLAEMLPEIEAALAAGHSHKVIFEDIKKTVGLNLTFGYYENTIHRLRQRNGAAISPKGQQASAKREQQSAQTKTLATTNPQAKNLPVATQVQTVLHGSVGDFFS
jgi:hypothetical protein